jgi:serine/threonine-protein kinase
MMGEKEKARKSFEVAREVIERTIEMRPGDYRVHSSLGIVYAALGREEDALREGKRAVEMMPVSADAVGGPRQVEHLAVIYMILGDFDAAVEKIDYLLSIPCFFSVPVIQIDPIWDPLRDHPGFQSVLIRHSKAES